MPTKVSAPITLHTCNETEQPRFPALPRSQVGYFWWGDAWRDLLGRLSLLSSALTGTSKETAILDAQE